VKDLWCYVEVAPDAVPDESRTDSKASALCNALNHISDGTEALVGPAELDGSVQTLVGGLDEIASLPIHITHAERLRAVAVVAIWVVHAHIDVDDVTVDERPGVWNTMACNVVDRGTDGLGEAPVSERGRVESH
jgi:hypothetical protein